MKVQFLHKFVPIKKRGQRPSYYRHSNSTTMSTTLTNYTKQTQSKEELDQVLEAMESFVDSFADDSIDTMLLTFRLMNEDKLYMLEDQLSYYSDMLQRNIDYISLPSWNAMEGILHSNPTKKQEPFIAHLFLTHGVLNCLRLVINEL